MASVTITTDKVAKTIAPGVHAQPELLAATAVTTNAVPVIRIPALNQRFTRGDNVTIKGGEVITSAMF